MSCRRPMKQKRFFLLLVLSASLRAQGIRFERIGLHEGLSQSSVYSITQDTSGFLWVGTFDGLNRFDGYEFKKFHHIPYDSLSLADNYIHAIHGSPELMVGTDEGLHVWTSGVFRRLLPTLRRPVYAIARQDQQTWIGMGGGLARMTADSVSVLPEFNGTTILALLIRGDTLWIGTEGKGLQAWDVRKRTRLMLSSESAGAASVRALMLDATGAMWVGTDRGVYEISGNTIRDHSSRISDLSVHAIVEDRRGWIWIGTSHGLNVRRSASSDFEAYFHDPSEPMSLAADPVQSLFVDGHGTVWVGTEFGGLHKFTDRMRILRVYGRSESGLRRPYIYPMLEDADGSIWMGTYGEGLLQFFPSTRRFRSVPLEAGRRLVYSLTSGDGLWFGTHGGGVGRLRAGAGVQYVEAGEAPDRISHSEVWAVLRDSRNRLWVGTSNGLNVRMPGTTEFQKYFADAGDTTALTSSVIQCIYEASDGIWIGTWGGGIHRVQEDHGKFRFERFPFGRPGELSGGIVMCFLEDPNRCLWIGTWGAGFSCLSADRRSVRSWTTRNGLANNSVYGILPDGRGRLWISTNRGLSRFDPDSQTFQSYDVSDGLPSNEFNTNSFLRSRNGEMYFGGIAGFVRFHPDSLRQDPGETAVRITNFVTRGGVVRPVQDGKWVDLPHDENDLSFEFAVMDFRSPLQNRFAYRLIGLHDDWREAGASHRADYSGLEPGAYTFRVIGCNSDGVWNRTGASVSFVILRAWWSHPLLWVSMGLMVAGGIIFQIRLRVRNLRREFKMRREFARALIRLQEEERKKIAAALHDGHGQNLLVILNELQRRVHSSSELRLTKEDLQTWAGWLSESLEEIRLLSHDLRPVQLSQLGLAQTVQSFLKKIPLTVDVLGDPETLTRFPRDADIHVFRIFQEAFANILKHSGATRVRIELHRDGSRLRIVIADNGTGLQNSKEGLGLIHMRERSRLIGGNLQISSSVHGGTRVELNVPVGR